MSVLKDSTINLKDVQVFRDQDRYNLHRAIAYRYSGNPKPFAVLRKLGWMLNGPLPQKGTAKTAPESLVAAEVDTQADWVKIWWCMEKYASKRRIPRRSKEDEKAIEMLKATMNFDGERFEVGLLWKNSKPHMPKNYGSSFIQMKSLEHRPEEDPQLKKRFQKTIDADVERGFVRMLDDVELETLKHTRNGMFHITWC